jgi:hypothetical protein
MILRFEGKFAYDIEIIVLSNWYFTVLGEALQFKGARWPRQILFLCNHF